MQNRSTTSPCHVVGTTNDRPAASSASLHDWYCSGVHPTRRNSTIDSSGSISSSVSAQSSIRRAAARAVGKRGLDRLGVGIGAVRGEAEPQRQASGPTREVVGVVARIPRFVGRVIGVQHVEVLGVLGVGSAGDCRIAVQQRARIERREEPLVRVDDEAVGALDAVEPVADARRGERRAAVGAVDVEPRVEIGGNVGGAGEVVDHADVRRARGGDDGEETLTIGVVECVDHRTQRAAGHATAVVGRHRHDVGVHRPRRLDDRRVGAG